MTLKSIPRLALVTTDATKPNPRTAQVICREFSKGTAKVRFADGTSESYWPSQLVVLN